MISNGGGVKQYIQLMGRGLVSLRASDGWFMWGNNAVANDIANISTPVVKDNFVFASTGYGTGSVMVEISPAPEGRTTARQRYFLDPGVFQNHHGGFVIVGDYVYGGHGESAGFPTCIELSTGKSMWPARAQCRRRLSRGHGGRRAPVFPLPERHRAAARGHPDAATRRTARFRSPIRHGSAGRTR